MRNRQTKRRDAFTLVELSVSMTAGSTLIILAIGLVQQSMSLASLGRQRSGHQRTLNRLAGEFRHDVHRAERCTVESPQRMQLVLPGDTLVTYEVREHRLSRQEPLADGRSRREAFVLDAHSTVTFESIDQPTRAVLSILRNSNPPAGQPRVDRKIAAVVGRLTAHERGDVSP